MRTIKVSEASGAVLDWLVAKCEGWEWKTGVSTWYGNKPWFELFLGDIPWGNGSFRSVDRCTPHELRYSTDWDRGGPIIARLMAQGAEMRQGGPSAGNQRCWFKLDSQTLYSFGPTPLIAAMRCYVASKLGETAEVPEELCK